MVAAGVMGGALPAAVWPPPVRASCTGAGGLGFSPALGFAFSGPGAGSYIAHNASARYRPILTAGAPAAGGIASISVLVQSADETLGPGTDYAYVKNSSNNF